MDCLPQIHVAAIHSQSHYEAFTPGLGLMCLEGDFLLGAGAYRNSLGRSSIYGAGGWRPINAGPVRVGAVLGLVTGYMYDVVPLGGILVSYENIHFTIIPEVEGKTPTTIGISFTVPFK